jgi:prevent-host-death family protein
MARGRLVRSGQTDRRRHTLLFVDATETVDVDEAMTQLSTLIDRAMAGEDVVIARAGRAMVRLVPVAARRTPGSARGQVRMAPDFDDLPREIGAASRGERP